MSTTYAGASRDRGPITIPSDTDLADAESVNRVFRALRDGVLLNLKVLAGRPIHQNIKMQSSDGTLVGVGAHTNFVTYTFNGASPEYGAFGNVTPVVVDPSYLDVAPGAWGASRAYYVYFVWDAVKKAQNYVVSLLPPREELHFGRNEYYRYCGCFLTDSSAKVIPFYKQNGRYRFFVPQLTVLTNATSYLTVNLNPWKPPHTTKVTLRMLAQSLAAPADDFSIRVGSFVDLYRASVTPEITDVEREILTTSLGTIEVKSGATQTQVSLYAFGFEE